MDGAGKNGPELVTSWTKLIILKFSIYELILDLDPAVIGQLSLYNMKSSVLDLVSSYNYLRISTL